MTLTVEDASARDLDRLYEIESECFDKEAFTKQQIRHLLTDYNSIGLVAKENGRIKGFIIGALYVDRNAINGHILTLDVSLSHRQKGIGQRLMLELEKILRERGVKSCHLEVREDNFAALRLYEKLGYKRVGKLPNYYRDAHGIYLMKTLA